MSVLVVEETWEKESRHLLDVEREALEVLRH